MTDASLMGSTEACDYLGIARSTLTQWLDKQWIVPVEKISSGYIFTTAEVHRAAEARAAEKAGAA